MVTTLDMDGQYKNEVELILKYRDMSQMSDCEIAIDNIVNEAIVVDDIFHQYQLFSIKQIYRRY